MSLSLTLIPVAIAVSSTISYAINGKLEEGAYFEIDTHMKDEHILKEALANYGCTVSFKEANLESTLGNIQILFQKYENDTLRAIFDKSIRSEDAEEFIKNIYSEYTRIVQQKTYEKLLQRAKEEGLTLESEQINEEDTIVLTFQVKE
ncbi:hypothetical protein [Pueribacillus sp. YX66]|uniref:hypothetical protein n=1 Tax=Pueribacillus sp. YX66 TaxID=3229242 RepID=UPI00358D7F90